MSYLEQLQIKKEPVKNSDFVIHLLGDSESKKKERKEKKEEKEEAKVYNEDGELEADYDEEIDETVEKDPTDKPDVEPPSIIPFFVDKTNLVKSKEPLKDFKVYSAALYPVLFTTIRTLLKTLWSAKFKGTR